MHPELHQVVVGELRIQQRVTLLPKAGDKIDQRDLAGIRRGREHAFAEERTAEGNAVDAADKFFALPGLHAMGMARAMQRCIEADDIVIDPGFRPRIGTAVDDACKIFIEADAVGPAADSFGEALWYMQMVDGKNAAPQRVVPAEFPAITPLRHGEDAHGIGLQQ